MKFVPTGVMGVPPLLLVLVVVAVTVMVVVTVAVPCTGGAFVVGDDGGWEFEPQTPRPA